MKRPELAAPPDEQRIRLWRAFFELLRLHHKAVWQALLDRLRNVELEHKPDACEQWLREHGLLDSQGLAVVAVMPQVLHDLGEPLDNGARRLDLHSGALALRLMLREYLRPEDAPRPVKLRFEADIGGGDSWKFPTDLTALRKKILQDFEVELERALEQYRRNLAERGYLGELSCAESERLALFLAHVIGGRSAGKLAKERRADDSNIRKWLREARAMLGLPSPRRKA
jgi:hypothetical protein